MSTGYFSRTGRNVPQKNLNKLQSTTQEVSNPSQINTNPVEQTSKSGYVYRPPTRIVRSNAINQAKQIVKEKVEEKGIEVKNDTAQQYAPVKSSPFMRKPLNQTQKHIKQAKNTIQSQITQEPKPVIKPISKLNTTKQVPPLLISTKTQVKSQQDVTSSLYQQKMVNHPQKSQSKTSFKSSQSKYSSKIQITSNEQQNVDESEVQKPQIKRSNLIIYSLHKITTQKYQSFFQQICAFSQLQKETKENEKTQKQFQRGVLKFCLRYENRLVQNAFGLMKSIYSKLLKIQMVKSTDPKISNQLIAKRNQCFIKVLESITSNQLAQKRQSLNKLKMNFIKEEEKKKKILYGAKILCNQEFKRLKQCWSLISEWSIVRNCLKSLKLGRCSEINKNLRNEMLFWSIRNMETFKLKQQNKEFQKESEQSDLNKELRQSVQQLERKLQQLKKNPRKSDEESQLRNKITGLKQESQKISEELEAKRVKNIQLKQKVEQLMVNKSFSQQQEVSLISENKLSGQEPTLSLLHEIYMKAFKQTEEQCISEQNIWQLCNIHKVQENQTTRETVAQWIAVQKNLLLKHQIDLYEGNYVTDNLQQNHLSSSQLSLQSILQQRKQKCRRLQQQNSIIKKFIRSYIKERYMWEQVKQYVAAAVANE